MYTRNGFKLLFLLFVITLVWLVEPTVNISLANENIFDLAECVPKPEKDLSGTLSETNRGTVTNSSVNCPYTVGIASYRKFDNAIAHQQIFDWDTITVAPGETIELEVDLPACAVQVDLFYGPVLFSLNDQLYGSRLLAVRHQGDRDYCTMSAPDCAIYATARQGRNDSQLLAIDLRAKRVFPISELKRDYDIEGLAFHPISNALYAVSGKRSTSPGELYLVDRETGNLNLIGSTGYQKLRGLSSHPTDATLWSWVTGIGLVQIDPVTAAAEVRFSDAALIWEDLTWSPDGTTLYGFQGRSLWVYRPDDDILERVATNLPTSAKVLEARPDGLLLSNRHNDKGIRLFGYDSSTQQVKMNSSIATEFRNIRALAWPAVCGNPSPGGEAHIIQDVDIDNSQVCAGENILVTVTAEHPELSSNPVEVSINDKLGSSRYLQFTGQPGKRLIQVTAATLEKHIDVWEGQVEVIPCGESQIFPIVSARMNPFQDLIVDLDILNAEEFESESPTYIWEFGDGQTAETAAPFVSHDYSEAIDTDQLYTVFQASVTVQSDGQSEASTHKTITVWSLYAYNKRRGIIQPHVTYETQLVQENGNYVGAFTIENFEDESIQFSSRLTEYQLCDPTQDATPLAPEDYTLEIGGQQKVTDEITIPVNTIPTDACGITVHLTGQAGAQKDTYVSLYFDLQENPLMRQPVTDPAMAELLNDIVERELVANPYAITDEDLYRLVRAGEIVYPPLPLDLQPNATAGLEELSSIPLGDVIGEPCFPDEEPPRPGVTCQATGEWTFAPPHIKNAHKGDIILSAGCGVIGDLLRKVSPSQRYSHTGIMTSNFYELRHSTASPKRYKDYGIGFTDDGSDGIRTDVIKYGWPGTITQQVDEAFNGEYRLDHENGKRYEIRGFSANPARCAGDLEITYPAVVKPPPGHDPSVRTRLKAAADVAKDIDGHYRFFSYTNAAISEDSNYNAPVGTGWAEGTLGTVCSSFIWTALKEAGIELEGPQLEPGDVYPGGAERDTATLDGLYFYTEAERKAGGQWLYNHFYNMAYEEAGWWGRLFTDAPDDVANQITNCFANDSCNKDSEDWRNPGVGRAVSPDNILFWDAPETGGVYGYSENLVYRAGSYKPETQWQASEGVGTVTGRVLLAGEPVENASVTLLGVELFTDSNGQFRDDLIPAGTYEIVAAKFIDGIFYSTRQTVIINSNATTNVELTLQPPPQVFRQVTVLGNMFIVDGEVFGSNETADVPIFGSRNLSPFNRREHMEFEGCAGDEVRIELDIDLRLESDNTTVVASGEARMYEESDCNNDDFEDSESFLDTIPINQFVAVSIDLRNNDIVDDTADIDFTVFNRQQSETFVVSIPSSGGTLQAGNIADFDFPANTFTETVTITYTVLEPFDANSHVGIFYDIKATYANDNSSVETVPGQNYVVTIHYNDAAIPSNRKEANLALFYWDGAAWIQEPTSTVDVLNHRIIATPDHFGIWAVLFKPHSQSVYLPVVLR